MDLIRDLYRAHEYLNRGRPERAARKLHRLADHLSRHGDLQHAAAVLLEAAYADALSGQANSAEQSVRIVLDTLGGSLRLEQLAPAAEQVSAALRQNGFQIEAANVDQSLQAALKSAGLLQMQPVPAGSPQPSQAHKVLPATCPSCGGPLLPKEVDWHDETTALCPFCGSVIKTA